MKGGRKEGRASSAPGAAVVKDSKRKVNPHHPVLRGTRPSVASLIDDDDETTSHEEDMEVDVSWEFDLMQIVRARSTDDVPASSQLLASYSSSIAQSSFVDEDSMEREKKEEKMARSSSLLPGQKRGVNHKKRAGWGEKSKKGQLSEDISVATATTAVMDESSQLPTFRRIYSNQCPPEKIKEQLACPSQHTDEGQLQTPHTPGDPRQSSAEFDIMKVVESRARAARLEMQQEEGEEEEKEEEESQELTLFKNGVPIVPLKGQQRPGAYAAAPGEGFRRMSDNFQLSANDLFLDEDGDEMDQTGKSLRDEMDETYRSYKSRNRSNKMVGAKKEPKKPLVPSVGIPLVQRRPSDTSMVSSVDLEDNNNKSSRELAIALPVYETSDEFHTEELPEAVEYSRTRRKNKTTGVFTVFSYGLCALILGIVLLVVYLTSSSKSSSAIVRIANETTMAPTSAPVENKLLMLLPNETIQELRYDDSPQTKAVQWMKEDPNLEDYSEERLVQRFALATLYYSTGGDDWYNMTHWLSTDIHECFWFAGSNPYMWGYGGEEDPLYEVSSAMRPCRNMSNVFDEEGGQYEHVWLSQNNLEGSIPQELYLLTSLRSISILGNKLGGTLSASIGQLRALEAITVGPNLLTGSIPTEIGLCSHLTVLAILSNQIGGSLPTELGNLSRLKYFMADNNRIAGTIPTAITELTNLEMLYLYYNSLQGSIPVEISMMKNLKDLQIQVNRISSSIPSTIGELKHMEALSLRGNLLTGTVPSEVGKLAKLELLNIRENIISGEIPSSIGNLQRLFYLSMAHNPISGSIPSEIGMLPFVGNPSNFSITALGRRSLPGGVLQLHNTSLSGSIPPELGQCSGLAWLNVNDNAKLTGNIPSELGTLSNLETLDLFSSSFSGHVPSEIGALHKISAVRIDNSLLSGNLPSELGLLQRMTLFNATNNFLSGTVPEEVGTLVNGGTLKYWNISDNGFSGVLPDGLCDLRDTASLGFDCSFILCGCNCLCNLW